MPALNISTPILGDRYYHIFNRANGNEKLFFNSSNYIYFLSLYKKYLNPFCDTLAFCLMPNHFHFVIKTHDVVEVIKKDTIVEETNIDTIGRLISEQFRRLFIAYSQAIKKQENIRGSLFSKPFKRLIIEHEDYLKYLIFYVHFNPEKHGMNTSFNSYRFSSYRSLISTSASSLNRTLVMKIFGSKNEFISYHNFCHDERNELILE